jgi:hypothetical protein
VESGKVWTSSHLVNFKNGLNDGEATDSLASIYQIFSHQSMHSHFHTIKMKPTISLIVTVSIIIIASSLVSPSQAQGNSTYAKIPDADLLPVEEAWYTAITEEKDYDFPSNVSFFCAWSTSTSSPTYWGVIRSVDATVPKVIEVAFNDKGVSLFEVPDSTSAPLGCSAQATVLCEAGPEKSKDIILPECPPPCTLYTEACLKSCPPGIPADVNCTSEENGKDFEGYCGCRYPGPEPVPPLSRAVRRWMGGFVFAAVMTMLMLS